MAKDKGITLVALIITIVVLVILAAVTINGLIKHNFIETVTEGTINYAKEQMLEKADMEKIDESVKNSVEKIDDKLANKEKITLNSKYKEKTTKEIKIEVTAIDSNNANLEYKIYTKTVGNKENDWIESGILSNQKSGETIVLTASGLKTFTEYFWKVEVSNGKIQETEESTEAIRTLCKGNKGNVCSNGIMNIDTSKAITITSVISAYKCVTCGIMTNNRGKQVYTCKQCKSSTEISAVACKLECAKPYFQGMPTISRSVSCHKCNGMGRINSDSCQHGLSVAHKYCSHKKTEQHDTL